MIDSINLFELYQVARGLFGEFKFWASVIAMSLPVVTLLVYQKKRLNHLAGMWGGEMSQVARPGARRYLSTSVEMEIYLKRTTLRFKVHVQEGKKEHVFKGKLRMDKCLEKGTLVYKHQEGGRNQKGSGHVLFSPNGETLEFGLTTFDPKGERKIIFVGGDLRKVS